MRKSSHPSHQTSPFEAPQDFTSRIEHILPTAKNAIDCSLCYEKASFVSTGVCGHREICWLCSLRLRWICKDLNCAICKVKLDRIEITSLDSSPTTTTWTLQDVVFQNFIIYQEASRLISYYCPYPCGDTDHFHFKSLRDLQTHLKRDHNNATFCEICLNHRQTFLPEQQVYSSVQILAHTKSEHPNCEFCKGQKFYSIDELLYHMNQVHFKCIVCDRLDYRNEYYANYDSLNSHCAEAHFPCEYPECKEQRFVVFGDEEELRLHWLEKHGRGRAISITGVVGPGGALGANASRKKFRNKYTSGQSIYNTQVHFRGSRTNVGTVAVAVQVVHEYPDAVDGHVYNARVHSQLPKRSSAKIGEILTKISSSIIFSDFQSQDYKSANIAFLKKLESTVSSDDLKELKNVSLQFKTGKISSEQLLKFLLSKFDTDISADLIVLMPDVTKRDSFIHYLKKQQKSPLLHVKKKIIASSPDSVAAPLTTGPVPEIPDQMFDMEKKPSLLHALFAVLNSEELTPARPSATKELPQSILSAMENKINALDRVQLTTLSEMRHHFLILAEGGNWGNPSWKHADEIITLRPLLYRLLQIPETHRSREKELIRQGWIEFVNSCRKILFSEEKFTKFELSWVRAYITISLLRSASIGPLEVKRGEFPTLPMSAYFPSAAGTASSTSVSQPVPTRAAPTRADFPSAIRPPTSAIPTVRLTSAGSTWTNYAHGLREEAFPELDIPSAALAAPRGPDLTRPWSCPRCTYTNSRPHSMNCEICGMDRPPDDEGQIVDVLGANVSASEPISSAAPKRVKKKIILSSATQRDYKR